MMLHSSSGKLQKDPLLPGYHFNAWLVAGLTPITAGGALDFFIDRPEGMKGYILNLTISGKGRVFEGEAGFDCEPGDMLLFQPQMAHYYGRAPDSDNWFHRWVYFRPRAFWSNWLQWSTLQSGVGRLRLPESLQAEFSQLFINIEQVHNSGRPFAEEMSMNLLENLLLRAAEEDPRHQQQVRDARIVEACQFMTLRLASDLKIEDIARHVCLSPSRLAHLFREQLGVNLLRWREDQRIIRARLLLQSTLEPVATVAREVGYDDQLYFSRVFRKRVGVSPSDFRRRSHEDDAMLSVEPHR